MVQSAGTAGHLTTVALGAAVAVVAAMLVSTVVLAPVHPSPSPSTTSLAAPPKPCLDGGTVGKVPPDVRVAFVKPLFTATPYSQYKWGSFYAFYSTYRHVTGNISTNLSWLKTDVRDGLDYFNGWGHSWPLYTFLVSGGAKNCGLVLGANAHVVSDYNVSQGQLFTPDGMRAYDAAVIGHNEYVTQAEYDQFRLFVAAGGRVVAMSSNPFYARVTFDPATLTETFVIGHGYAFNGQTAWHTSYSPFATASKEWFGSVHCCFHRFQYSGGIVNASNPIGRILAKYYGGVLAPTYYSHEEDAVANYNHTSIVATFLNQSGLVVASYAHGYGRGAVFCLCVFGEDILLNDSSTRMFLVASLTSPYPGYQASAHGQGTLILAASSLSTPMWPVRRFGAHTAEAPTER